MSRGAGEARDAFRMPTGEEWPARLRSVLHILYLIFNEGYLPTGGPELAREDISREAIRLARIAHRALPDDPEVAGLLSLMLLTEARRAARTTARGELVPLDEQDRSLWERELIAEGVELARVASSKGSASEYLIQAQIAALHDTVARSQDTDWRRIAGLNAVLEQMTSNPIVSLNGAIAVAMFEGPETGLALLQPLEQPLAVGLVLSGQAVAKMHDGREVVMHAGDFFYFPPGHDSLGGRRGAVRLAPHPR